MTVGKTAGTRPASPEASLPGTDKPSSNPIASAKGVDANMYRLLVTQISDYAIIALDPSGIVLSWNEGARRSTGYSADEIIGKHFSVFYTPEDLAAEKPVRELETATREGRVEDEGWRLRKDGSPFWAHVVITALRDDAGKLIGFAKVTRDLTERRLAEEMLRESEERFQLLVQSVKDYGIFMLDPTGHVASWNEGAERIKGYTAQEIIGRHFSAFYPPEDLAANKPGWELEIAAREGRFEDEGGWRVRKDGSLFWANVVITALRTKSGELVGFAKVTRDLTERRAAQERAIADTRRIAEVEVANRTKSEFLASMSHELRTPLNAIGGYTELIELEIGGPITEQQQSYLSRIRGSQQHLLGIISDLLNYSRLEAGQVTYDIQSVQVRDIVESVVPLLEPQAVTKDVRLEYEPCPPDLLVRADRTKAEQILLNLVSNALKFTPAGGSVRVSCKVRDERVDITVRDTGVGIPEDKLSAIFEPFVQLGRSLSNMREGTGLGLSISRELARAMHGDVTVESTVHAGSTFTVSLPVAPAQLPR